MLPRLLLILLVVAGSSIATASEPFTLQERTRTATENGQVVTQLDSVKWAPEKTALIICDVWDLHTSQNATLRTGELAPHIDALAKEVRARGGIVIHCPSGCMEHYKDHPARAAAQSAPAADNLPEKIGSWCYKIPSEGEIKYPLDQSNPKDDAPAAQSAWAEHLASIGRKTQGPWIKEHPEIAIEAGDYITDRGNEVWNILEAKNIKHVLFTGVHTNMCVLGRPFGLRRLVENGKDAVLVRDLTDTMYNPDQRPYVSHFTGTDRIVAYIEQVICPTITSDQILGGRPFQFKDDNRIRLAIVCSEPEYNTATSLAKFAKRHLGHHFKISYILEDPEDDDRLVGLDQLENADVMLLSVRRRALPKAQLEQIRAFFEAGKPVVGIRTANHSFSLRGKEPPEGRATWESFDGDIFGGHYHSHHGNGPTTTVALAESANEHPILRHVTARDWTTPASLYEVRPLKDSTTPLLTGSVPKQPAEPIAWTNSTIYDGRAFYTSLGHIEDFKKKSFRRLLFNSLFWAAGREIPAEWPDAKAAANLDRVAEASDKKFTVPEDLVWEPVLAEPRIGQPVYLHFDERGRLWVMEYLQYPYPAGLKMLSKDEHWRAVYDHIPKPPPHGEKGADRISIHADTDGDGQFDKHTVFLEGLSIATSFARGRGGVFVLNPPYLLFYPDRNRDDVPDGEPEVLLEGFGLEDTHSVVNSLRFGPDGWLYACQGSTVSGDVRRFGSDDPPISSMGQLVWRYHPEKKIYEIFAEGGGNAFGLEIDAAGNIYSGHNGGDTHGFHYIPGGYYRKTFGKHGALSNPYTYGYYQPIAHDGPVPRFTHDFVIYEGDTLPQAYRGKLFAIDPLGQRLTLAEITPKGSTFATRDLSQVVQSAEESLFRPVNIVTGPDGAIYVADFHEENITHGGHFEGKIMKQTGRVYRLRGAESEPIAPFDLAKKSTTELVALLDHPNHWHRQTALRLLYDRQDAGVVPRLRKTALATSDAAAKHPLDHLWALFGLGGLDEKTTLAALDHPNPLIRSWTVRLACDDGTISSAIAQRLIELAGNESDVRVQVQLACFARQLPAETCLGIIESLLSNELNTEDPFLPLACWWAIEAQCETAPQAVVDFFIQPSVQAEPLARDFLAERIMRRLASGSRSDLAQCARLLGAASDAEIQQKLLTGFEAALRGRNSVSLPEPLVAALAKLGDLPLTLRLRQGDPQAIEIAIKSITNAKQPEAERIELATLLGQAAIPAARPALLKLFKTGKTSVLRRAALAALAAYPDENLADTLVIALPQRQSSEQIAILSVLVSRPAWSERLLSAIEEQAIDPAVVPIDLARRMLLHENESLTRRAKSLWPELASTSQNRSRDPATLGQLIAAAPGDPFKGRRVFTTACGRCHTLFGEGGNVGPDLTSDPRNDLSRLIASINTPSKEIREGYEGYTAVTTDGRVIAGLLTDQDEHVVILREADGRNVILSRDEIEVLVRQPKSLMPEGLLKTLSDQEVRDLFAYLRSSQPLTR